MLRTTGLLFILLPSFTYAMDSCSSTDKVAERTEITLKGYKDVWALTTTDTSKTSIKIAYNVAFPVLKRYVQEHKNNFSAFCHIDRIHVSSNGSDICPGFYIMVFEGTAKDVVTLEQVLCNFCFDLLPHNAFESPVYMFKIKNKK